MALAVNDIVQLTDVQTFLGQEMLNVYFYRIVSLEALTDLNDVAEAWDNEVRIRIVGMQSTSVTHPRILVKNLTNGLDIAEVIDSDVGEAGGDELASFYALGYRLVRTNASTRHGAKRIGGIPEAAVKANDLVAAYVAQSNLIATALAADITRTGTVDHDLVAEPVIVGRVHQPDPDAGELDLSVINPVASAQFIRVTTQTTRRAGRGS